jgi:hypothetical protein
MKLNVFYILFFLSQTCFAQQEIKKRILENKAFKYEYTFTLDNETLAFTNSKVLDDTVYQINSKNELDQAKLSELIDCIKKSIQKNGSLNTLECSEKDKIQVLIQI